MIGGEQTPSLAVVEQRREGEEVLERQADVAEHKVHVLLALVHVQHASDAWMLHWGRDHERRIDVVLLC